MLANILAPALIGMDGETVEIECDLVNSLPGMVIVGLGDKAVEEARERVRSALKNSGLFVPAKRITLNLAPADLPKDGTGYDLGLAVAILTASEQIPARAVNGRLFYGELALEGSIRPVRGALVAAELAVSRGIKELFMAPADAAATTGIIGTTVYGVPTLRDLFRHLSGEKRLKAVKSTTEISVSEVVEPEIDLSNIYGQDQAKRALEIAAGGGHHLLLTGPPGGGKTMLAHALAGLLPPPSTNERLEINKLYNLAGLTPPSHRPFRSPHHTASSIALIGGGTHPRPGEITLSHHGVLLLDEVPEFHRGALEVLRGPLEDNVVTVSRASRSVTYPAKFLLIATRNPCPCGYAGDNRRKCTCQSGAIRRYTEKLSGPLLDRIDLSVEVARLDTDHLVARLSDESTASVRQRVMAARNRQHKRYGETKLNAHLTSRELKKYCPLDTTTELLARHAIDHLGLSARSYHRVIKVSRTIADLADSNLIMQQHFTEALQYRARPKT